MIECAYLCVGACVQVATFCVTSFFDIAFFSFSRHRRHMSLDNLFSSKVHHHHLAACSLSLETFLVWYVFLIFRSAFLWRHPSSNLSWLDIISHSVGHSPTPSKKNAHFLWGFLKETQEKLSEFPNSSQTWLVVFSQISLAPSRGQAGIEAWCWDVFGCKHRLLQHTIFRQGAARLTPYRKGKEIGMMRQRQQYVPYEMPCRWISLPSGLSDNGLATAASQQSTAGLTIFLNHLDGLVKRGYTYVLRQVKWILTHDVVTGLQTKINPTHKVSPYLW